MKAKSIKINTGAACDTRVTRVESNNGELLGFIRVVNIDWTPVLGMGTYFAAHQCNAKVGYDMQIFRTLADAYEFIGVSNKELDSSELPDHCFSEF